MHEEDFERGEGAGGQDVVYETDEEEFMPDKSTVVVTFSTAMNPVKGPVKILNTAKRNVSVQKIPRNTAQQYNLAYFNLWWVRMAVEGRKKAKERRRKEEEESRSMRKSKWRTSRRRGVNEKDTKVDGTEVNPSQVECQQEENTLRGGTDTYRGKSEWIRGEGVELPTDDTIYERSQAMNTITSTSNNGISDFSKIVGDNDLAPGSSAVDLLE